MHHLDESNAECLVFTRKEGLLSAVAHDLKIRIGGFRVDVDEDARTADGRFDTASLRVVCAMREGRDAESELSAAQKAEIEANIVRHVLHPDRHPEARFVSSSVETGGGGFIVRGKLELHGASKVVEVSVEKKSDRWVAISRIHQPDFGIRPYSALLGTLKVHADVEIRFVVPWPPGAGAQPGVGGSDAPAGQSSTR